MKTILLFSDGTGNSSASLFKTNVWRIYDALDMSPDKGQISYYDDGVGSSSYKFFAAIGGAFGYGLKRNVLDIYKFLSRQYGQAIRTGGDAPKIACFGFSRGAFTIRVLIGLIDSQGLLTAASDAELDRLANRAYLAYREEKFHTWVRIETPMRWVRNRIILPIKDRLVGLKRYEKTKNTLGIKIDFLGLWDAVGAYGMPIEEFRQAIDHFIFPLTFSDRNLLPIVKVARHALSIDDERDAFTPILFDGVDARLEQRWFAGVHANIGGGYSDDSMSFAPLKWILDEARKQKFIAFRDDAVREIHAKATPYGQIYDSRSGFGGLYRYAPRDIEDLSAPNIPLVDESVVFRMAQGFDGYAPIALPENVAVADEHGHVLGFKGFKDAAMNKVGRFAKAGEGAPDPQMEKLAAAVAKLKQPDSEQVRLIRAAVFWRRVVYQFTILPLILLVGAPLLDHREIDDANPISFILGFVAGLLPSYFAPWFTSFREYPWYTLGLAAIALASFLWGGRLKTLIGDRSRAAWGVTGGDPPQSLIGRLIWDPLALAILDTKQLRFLWNRFAINIIPSFLAFLTVFVVIPTLVDRVAFQAQSYFGLVCRDGTPAATPLREPRTFDFDPASPCQRSQILLENRKAYLATFEISDEWADKSIPADLSGLDQSQLGLWDRIGFRALALMFRRVATEPWFEPILRVGAKGFAEIPARPSTPFQKGSDRRKMTVTFRSAANGELFVFVNDAYPGIFPFAWLAGESKFNADGSWRHTYGNNRGKARITVERAHDDARSIDGKTTGAARRDGESGDGRHARLGGARAHVAWFGRQPAKSIPPRAFPVRFHPQSRQDD